MTASDLPGSGEHAAFRPLDGTAARLAAALAVGLSLGALYWVLFIIQPQVYRVGFLLVALVLTFLLFPRVKGSAAPVSPLDWTLMSGALAALSWPLIDFTTFVYRAAEPLPIDLLLGSVAILLVLEATRRTVGWVLPLTAISFLAYAWLGPFFDRVGLSIVAHRGYGIERLIGSLYMTLEGVFGLPLDVTATYIILFTIYGAVLEQTGAGTYLINLAMSAGGRSRAAPGRSVTLAGFLLGTVSGSGVATTVMLGSVAWPVLRRAGYAAETAGAMLSAAGIGALLSPPTLGAAAFLIAEFLRISYLQVLIMATVPTLLYYLSIFVMIEADAQEATPAIVPPEGGQSAARRLRAAIGPLTSLIAIGAFMFAGMSAFRAVFWATVLAAALSYLSRATALTPTRLLAALRFGGQDVLSVAATTATAGIIVGVVTLTGLGLKIAGIIVALAGGTLGLTVIYSAVAVWLLGLAVPVTASYIIAAVMVAPALVSSGVPDFAAHMFIFYYAVLSEVSPPTALSPFAAAALTGGNPFRTMVLTWKYTLPAFVVPLVFTLAPAGTGVLLRGPAGEVLISCATAAAGTLALAGACGGWLVHRMGVVNRAVLAGSGLVLLFGAWPWAAGAGATAVLVLILQSTGHSRPKTRGSAA
jgi:TRAP transporter 4TM/12TM fusion protein